MKNKRKYRELSDETKNKIRQSMVGKAKSEQHKEHISQAMKQYWSTVPHKEETTTMGDVIEYTA